MIEMKIVLRVSKCCGERNWLEQESEKKERKEKTEKEKK